MPAPRKEQRVVAAVARACDLLKAFHSQKESLRLRDLVVRTGLNKATAFRILQTLEQQGFIERCGPREYRSRFRAPGYVQGFNPHARPPVDIRDRGTGMRASR